MTKDSANKSGEREKICFGIHKNQRKFLNIVDLCDIKRIYPDGLEALQLFKIPTREFMPYFYFHTMIVDKKQNQGQMFTRIPHRAKDIQQIIKSTESGVESDLFGSEVGLQVKEDSERSEES